MPSQGKPLILRGESTDIASQPRARILRRSWTARPMRLSLRLGWVGFLADVRHGRTEAVVLRHYFLPIPTPDAARSWEILPQLKQDATTYPIPIEDGHLGVFNLSE